MEDMLLSIGIADTEFILAATKATIRIMLVLLGAWVLMRISKKAIQTLKNQLLSRVLGDLEEVKRIDTLEQVFRYIAGVVIGIVTFMVVLNQLGISIAPILAAAGVVGLAVGFGAQSLVKDYFTGFFLLLENQIRQGDVVEAGGKSGLVEQVTLRYLRMRDYSGNVHYIPNGLITTVTNMSREFANAVIDVGVAYRENVDEVIAVMTEVGQALRADEAFASKILEDIEIAGVNDWADSAVIVRCRFKVLPLEQWGVRREYLKRLKAEFDRRGIEIPFPHLTVYPGELKNGEAPALRVSSS